MASKATESALRAGFRAGWVAACKTLADECTKAGGADIAAHFLAMADRPPRLEVGDLSTPEGKAMRAQPGQEIVMVESYGKGSRDGG